MSARSTAFAFALAFIFVGCRRVKRVSPFENGLRVARVRGPFSVRDEAISCSVAASGPRMCSCYAFVDTVSICASEMRRKFSSLKEFGRAAFAGLAHCLPFITILCFVKRWFNLNL